MYIRVHTHTHYIISYICTNTQIYIYDMHTHTHTHTHTTHRFSMSCVWRDWPHYCSQPTTSLTEPGRSYKGTTS